MLNQQVTNATRLLVIACLIVIGCDWTETSVDVRIGKQGIDELTFGDSLGAAIAKLGDPGGASFVSGIGVGYQGWVWGDSLVVYTLDPNFLTSSPIDAFLVSGSYSGQTTQGLRIGLTYEEVLDLVGEPFYHLQESFKVYCLDSRYLQLGIRFGVGRDSVENIFYGEQLPGGAIPSCPTYEKS